LRWYFEGIPANFPETSCRDDQALNEVEPIDIGNHKKILRCFSQRARAHQKNYNINDWLLIIDKIQFDTKNSESGDFPYEKAVNSSVYQV
jgi:hypothetical protein